MEIYSPGSKNKDLFKKNQLKSKQIINENPEITPEIRPLFTPVEVVYTEDNIFVRTGKVIVEKLKIFFEINETV